MEPHSRKSVSQPWTAPGTVTEWTPAWGMERWPSASSKSMVWPFGERPLPLMARTDFSRLFQTRANMSPPTPVDTGSTTFRTAALAIAASTALPPCIRTRIPATAARGWLVATIPCLAKTVDRRESKYIFTLLQRKLLHGEKAPVLPAPLYHGPSSIRTLHPPAEEVSTKVCRSPRKLSSTTPRSFASPWPALRSALPPVLWRVPERFLLRIPRP